MDGDEEEGIEAADSSFSVSVDVPGAGGAGLGSEDIFNVELR